MLFRSFAAAIALFSVSAQAAPISAGQLSAGFKTKSEYADYLTIKNVEIREIETTPEMFAAVERAALFQTATFTLPTDLGTYIQLGEKVFDVIVKNKPVSSVQTQKISVLPKSQPDWSMMENWRGPIARTYLIEAKNLYGMAVISHAYTIAYNYGGSFEGAGQYIANATIIPSSIDVSWGYTLNSRVEVGEVVNTATKKNPVPGVSLQLIYSIDTVLKHSEGRDTFFIRGDGQTQKL